MFGYDPHAFPGGPLFWVAWILRASSKEDLDGFDLSCAVKAKNVDVSNDLVVRRNYFDQQEQVIAALCHFNVANLFEELVSGPTFLFELFNRNMVVVIGAGECKIVGKLTSDGSPVVIFKP